MSESPHTDVRRAFVSSIEAPEWSREGLTPLFSAVTRHMDSPTRAAWKAQGGLGGEIEDELRDALRARLAPVGGLSAEVAASAFLAAYRKDLASFVFLSALLGRVAFISPESTIPVYSVLAAAFSWGGAASLVVAVSAAKGEEVDALGAIDRIEAGDVLPPITLDALEKLDAESAALSSPGRLPVGFIGLFWNMVGEPVDAATITPKIASFASVWPPARKEAEVRAMLQHDGAARVIDEPFERGFTLESLADEPGGSLGRALHDLIVGNGYDFDILEAADSSRRESSSEGVFHPRIDPISRRLLFTHDIFHLVGGYSTSPLQEVGIVGFQLAQFGNGYARDFIPTVLTLTTLTQPLAAWATLTLVVEGWQHGRSNPPLICIDWNQELDKPLAQIRDELSFTPFVSVLPDVSLDLL